MASNFGRDLAKLIDDQMEEIDRKMGLAFQRTMKRMEPELLEVMQDATYRNYYRGYFPHVYIRTNQLKTAVKLSTENISNNDVFSFKVIPEYDETGMNHREYDIIATYKHKKNKKFTGKVSTHKYHVKLKKKPDEEELMELTLGEGYHPKVGTAGTTAPIWIGEDDDSEGYLFDMLGDYIQENFDKYFNEEYDKL